MTTKDDRLLIHDDLARRLQDAARDAIADGERVELMTALRAIYRASSIVNGNDLRSARRAWPV